MSATVVVLLAVAWTELRIAELLLSESNVGPLLARGAREHCAGQHRRLLLANGLPPLAAVSGLALRWQPPVGGAAAWCWLALVLLVAAESLHWWAIATLGRRWTTSVYVVPGEQPIRRGPYRRLRHPGYVGGVASAVLLPLVAGAWWGSLVVAVVMAAVVVPRIRCEDAAWSESAEQRAEDASAPLPAGAQKPQDVARRSRRRGRMSIVSVRQPRER